MKIIFSGQQYKLLFQRYCYPYYYGKHLLIIGKTMSYESLFPSSQMSETI